MPFPAVGLGLSLIAPFIVSDLLASRELVPLLRDYRLPEMEIVAPIRIAGI